ncbi:hypothetical protein [Hungatella hathewayi]|uniref:hypothetical protein n=1 Tax=Hungatella hathewayi TaxID=154046 RepID=UPI003567E217
MLNSGKSGSVRSWEQREADGSEIVIAMFRGVRCTKRPPHVRTRRLRPWNSI